MDDLYTKIDGMELDEVKNLFFWFPKKSSRDSKLLILKRQGFRPTMSRIMNPPPQKEFSAVSISRRTIHRGNLSASHMVKYLMSLWM